MLFSRSITYTVLRSGFWTRHAIVGRFISNGIYLFRVFSTFVAADFRWAATSTQNLLFRGSLGYVPREAAPIASAYFWGAGDSRSFIHSGGSSSTLEAGFFFSLWASAAAGY